VSWWWQPMKKEDRPTGFDVYKAIGDNEAFEEFLFQQKAPKPPVPIISVGKSKRRIVFED
jgi:hypothetical protein